MFWICRFCVDFLITRARATPRTRRKTFGAVQNQNQIAMQKNAKATTKFMQLIHLMSILYRRT